MKRIALVLAILVVGVAFGEQETTEEERQAQEIRRLQRIIAEQIQTLGELRRELAQFQRENKKLKNEITSMKELLEPDVLKEFEAEHAVPTYRGEPYSDRWFEAKYKEFHDKIIFVDGEYIDVSKAVAGDDSLPQLREIGTLGDAPRRSEVLQVISETEILVQRPGVPAQRTRDGIPISFGLREITFHVKGVDTTNLVDGVPFEGRLISIGTYRVGAHTIPSYAHYAPLTKEQFREALNKGVELPEVRGR